MKKIYVADMTLGDACKHMPISLSFKEKLEIARSLDKMGVDVLELCEIGDAKIDSLLIRTIASFVKSSTISVNAGVTLESVELAYNAVCHAKRPRLSVSLPVSPALIEYNFHLKPAEMLSLITNLVSKAKSLCADVEFRAVDSFHSEKEFLYSALQAAIAGGATTVTVCDNEGSSLPQETEAFIKRLLNDLPILKSVNLGYLCENNFGLGLSSLITAMQCGAQELKIAVGCAGYTSIDRFNELIKNRGDSLKYTTSLSKTELGRLSKQIKWITSSEKGEQTAFDKLTLSNSPLKVDFTANDDSKAINKAIKRLGYDLDAEDKKKVYEEFLRVVAKKSITARELDAIVASVAMQVPQAYKLISYVINSSNLVTASANIALERDGIKLQGVCLGDGPIDAAFLAIEQIVGRHYELDDFQIQAVTEGREAMGSAIVKLRGSKLYSGQGLSTDIIGASILAYLSALNKIIYEED